MFILLNLRQFFVDLHLHPTAVGLGLGVALSTQFACHEQAPVPSSAGPATNGFLIGRNAFTQPIPGLTRAERDDFIAGRTLFVQSWVQAPASTQTRDGLGPLFNDRACENCHPQNGRSNPVDRQGNLSAGLLFRVGSIQGPDPVYGGQIQTMALPDVPVEAKVTRTLAFAPELPELITPKYHLQELGYGELAPDSGISPRIGGALAGLGLIEAVPVARWMELEDPDDRDGDGISGRVHWVDGGPGQPKLMGRFGWKAEQPSLISQTASAYHDDMGLTSPLAPQTPCTSAQGACLAAKNGGDPEISQKALEQTAFYVQLLAVPRSEQRMPAKQWYANLARFERLGCASCHVPSHQTAAQGVLAPLADIEIWPFTDLLLHDMGPDLADTRPLPMASAQEWRTPPLWGLGHYKSVNGHQALLHDGRAQGVASAIAWHGGEAQASRDAFFALSDAERLELVAFIEQL